MKIIFSPSKSMKIRKSKIKINFPSSIPLCLEKANILRRKLADYSKEEFGKIFKINGKLLDENYLIAQKKGGSEEKEAIFFYYGISYRQLEIDKYNIEEIEYLEKNIVILSAMYGILNPFNKIKIYRLDMGIKILQKSLYDFWQEKIDLFFNKDEIIINLASQEFSKMLNKKNKIIIDIEFRQLRNGKLKNISTEAKKARGIFLNYMIINKIKNLDELKKFNFGNYIFSEENSTPKKFLFVSRD